MHLWESAALDALRFPGASACDFCWCSRHRLASMRPFEVDDISPIDMERVQQLTADFMRAENCRRPGAQQEEGQRDQPESAGHGGLLLAAVADDVGL